MSTPAQSVSAPAATGDDALAVLSAGVTAPLATGGEVEYAALDYAASAPVLRRVWDEVAAHAPLYGSVHRGTGHLSRLTTGVFEDARRTVAGFVGARADDRVLFTRSTTDSLNLLAAALPAGTRVFVFETEHHAALLPWAHHGHDVTWLDAPASPAEAVATAAAAFATLPAGRPALLCVTGASNVTGELWPVRELAAAAHRSGVRVALDAAQLVPHRRVDIGDLDVDWVAFSGHKLYAPFGSGVLAGRGDWLDRAAPYLAGGGATRLVTRAPGGGVAVEWAAGEARHEAGSPNVIGALAVAAACRALTDAGPGTPAGRERHLLGLLRDGLATIPAVRELSLFGADAERVPVVSFTVEGWSGDGLARALSDRYGIGVRAGLFCAQPLVRRLLGEAGADGDCEGPLQAVRASFGAGTPEEHVTRLVTAVRRLAGA
ncbi:aminotransferase class V-fold PLP-dependent enzyme [Streptomyces sp. RFCAC02]|uniref:aminotransferase class V-fold PLP-dependent enzyme n=1 Tax=Streptomyces sp. RFCAC02 TaxID=2499143 RepID=UPI001021050B|nr:aminotransferase class V-fold PLP-dependent enzyme [Streptomyces sp. RFCAC02]